MMGYIQNYYLVGNTIEVEKVHSGRYGKRIPVSEKTKPTSEAVKRVNFRNKMKRLRRLIQNNFTEEDFHIVLTYRKDNRPQVEEAKKLLRSFHGKMKRRYEKYSEEYRWICVTEYRTAAIHHHLVINSIEGVNMIKLLKECWQQGHINITPLYQDIDVEGLAEYLLKETKDTERKKRYEGVSQPSGYNASRNLKPVKKITKIIRSNEWRKEPMPLKGYYIDKNSIASGVSELTGYGYQYYRMIKIKMRD